MVASEAAPFQLMLTLARGTRNDVNPRGDLADLSGKGFGGSRGEDRVEIAAPLDRPLRGLGAMDAML